MKISQSEIDTLKRASKIILKHSSGYNYLVIDTIAPHLIKLAVTLQDIKDNQSKG